MNIINKDIKNIIGLYLLPSQYEIKCRKEQCLNQIIIHYFISNNIVKDKGKINIISLYQSFKIWFIFNYKRRDIPTKNELKEYLTYKWKSPVWIDYKYKFYYN